VPSDQVSIADKGIQLIKNFIQLRVVVGQRATILYSE